MLALVGDAKDGRLPGKVFDGDLGTGIRLGVLGASPGTDVVGDVLRRFDGDSMISEKFVDCPYLVLLGRFVLNGLIEAGA
jgi:hypothetical protein